DDVDPGHHVTSSLVWWYAGVNGPRRALLRNRVAPALELGNQLLVAISGQGVRGLALAFGQDGGDLVPDRQGPGALANVALVLVRLFQPVFRDPVEDNLRVPVFHAAGLIIGQHEGADRQFRPLTPTEPVAQKCISVGLSGVYGLQNLGPVLLS